MVWLLEFEMKKRLEAAENLRTEFVAQQSAYEASYAASEAEDLPRIMKVVGGIAELAVSGILTKKPDYYAYFFGGGNTTYGELNTALLRADADPAIERIDLRIDSPGGSIDGLFDVLATFSQVKTPTRAIVHNMAASAAYSLASQAGEIIAGNRAARFGSVGVVVSYYKPEGMFDITSTNAPKKRPDPSTEEGQKVIREQLDALHELFVEAIATGRNKTVEKVNAEFGEGSLLVADEALKRGMIDSVEGSTLRMVPTSAQIKTVANGGENGNRAMDLENLRAQHPDVYSAAVKAGVTQERDRVSAHLLAGEMSGDLETALKAAKEGTEMTTSLQTQYLMTAANRRDQGTRDQDDAAAAAALNTPAGKENADTQADEVMALVESKLGLASE